jgi:hypothetical protein
MQSRANRAKSSIVVRGAYVKYVDGLDEGDYGVVLPNTIVVFGGFVHGVLLDCNGRRSDFRMPLEVFKELDLVELAAG